MRMSFFRNIILYIGLVSVFSVCFLEVRCLYSEFKKLSPNYKESKLYNVSVGLENVSGTVACFGDFNNDKLCEKNFLFQANLILPVAIYSLSSLMREQRFDKGGKYEVFSESEKAYVEDMTAGDFDGDGYLDVLVQGRIEGDDWILLKIFFGDGKTFSSNVTLEKSYRVQVMVFDFDGDLRLDLLGNAEINGSIQRAIWRAPFVDKHYPEPWDAPGELFASPHSNAVVDVNGDCAADLVLTTEKHHEIYLWDSTNLRHASTPALKILRFSGFEGQITFADVDGDGNVDMIIPVCTDSTCRQGTINVLYNLQLKVCSSIFDKNCRSPSSLCMADPKFGFSGYGNWTGNRTGASVQVPMQNLNVFRGLLTVRAGDFNFDMYPDLLVPVKDQKGVQRVEIWENVKCNITLCSREAVLQNLRTFVRWQTGVEDLNSVSNAVSGIWFDLFESALNDILLITATPDGQFGVVALQNNFFNDGYFIKLLSLSIPCVDSDDSERITTRFYGGSEYGVTYKITFTNLTEYRMTSAIPQLPQSSYMSLQTPYIISGVGRPNNYIDRIFVGKTMGKNKNFRYWSGIIPNSQLVVFSCRDSLPSDWKLEMFLIPSAWFHVIITVYAIFILICLLVVALLQYRENKEDEREIKEKEHLYSFRAFY